MRSLSEEQQISILKLAAQGLTQQNIAIILGLSRTTVGSVVKRGYVFRRTLSSRSKELWAGAVEKKCSVCSRMMLIQEHEEVCLECVITKCKVKNDKTQAGKII